MCVCVCFFVCLFVCFFKDLTCINKLDLGFAQVLLKLKPPEHEKNDDILKNACGLKKLEAR